MLLFIDIISIQTLLQKLRAKLAKALKAIRNLIGDASKREGKAF